MVFKKGEAPPGAGRPKGIPNRSTIEFKEACANFIRLAAPQMVGWLEEIAREDKSKALEHVYKFAQFCYPLLARSEHTGYGGGPVVSSVRIEIVGPAEDVADGVGHDSTT